MKTQNVSIKFYQVENNATELNFDLQINEGASNSLIFGTILNELYFHLDSTKQIGSKLFNLREPILLKVETNTHYFDFAELNKSITQKFKLGYSAKSKRNFARRVNVALEIISHLPKYSTMEDLILELNKQIEE